MKSLILCRHAKSSWDLAGLSDHDRPLNERGRRNGPAMAAALAQRGVHPDRIVSSTATRARETAALLAEGLGIAPHEIELSESLYLASPQAILEQVGRLDEDLDSALLVGHNPGMHEAVNRICGSGEVDRFPTLAVARIELSVEFWGEVDRATGLLVELLTPRELREG